MAASEKPIGIALVICDRVITDATTQEKTLVSTFNQILTRSFPCVHPRLSIFVALTNGRGTSEAEIRCLNESDQDHLVFGMKGSIPFPDPNHVVEMNFQFNNVRFDKPGLHGVEFLCDGELVLQSRFQVTLMHSAESSQ